MFRSTYLHTPVGIKDMNQKNLHSSLHSIDKIYESKHDFTMQMWDFYIPGLAFF